MSRVFDERGSAPVEFVWITLVLLVPFVYVVIAVFDVQRASYAVSVASQSAARAYLQAPDVTAAQASAQRAARVALTDQSVVDATVHVQCLPDVSACLQPGSSVRVVVRTTQPLPLTPDALGRQLGGVTVDSTHIEPYGQFRSGTR